MRSRPSSPKPKLKHSSDSFQGIGTEWTVEIWTENHQESKPLFQAIRERVSAFEATYSRFRSESLNSRMAQKAGDYTLANDAKPMLDLYQKVYKITNGSVTPLIGQALSDAGYDKSYSLHPRTIHAVPTWEESMRYDFPILHIKNPVLLDFGGFGKGALIDVVCKLLEEESINRYVINAGGDMLCKNDELLEVGLQNPHDPEQAVGVAKIKKGALCGSAGTYRHWAQYTHILNPHTLQSPKDYVALWVYADSAILADAMTSALYFQTPEELHKHFSFEYAIMKADGSLECSDSFPATFFKAKKAQK